MGYSVCEQPLVTIRLRAMKDAVTNQQPQWPVSGSSDETESLRNELYKATSFERQSAVVCYRNTLSLDRLARHYSDVTRRCGLDSNSKGRNPRGKIKVRGDFKPDTYPINNRPVESRIMSNAIQAGIGRKDQSVVRG